MSGYATCPACKGVGEIATTYCACCDSMNTEQCVLCRGMGEVRADVAMAYLEQAVSP